MSGERTLLQFQPDACTVSRGGETIRLLPKEFALFQFLYEHAGRPFSRAELLDRVWGLEDPTDRTVDDHIYRLRKKLRGWRDAVTIDTVRGVGYRLTRKGARLANPLVSFPEFSQNVYRLLELYHGMGMGAALQTLSAHRDVLGIELDPFYAVYIRFVRGDFAWFVETSSLPFEEKLFYLLHIFSMVQKNPRESLRLFERVRSEPDRLPPRWRDELEINVIGLYLETGQWDKAERQMAKAEGIVARLGSDSFTLLLRYTQILYALLRDRLTEAEQLIRRSEEQLSRIPMQRELGSLTLLKGMCMYRRAEQQQARQLVEEGMEVLRASRFVPHVIYGVRLVLFFLDTFGWDAEWQHKYSTLWEELAAEYRFDYLARSIPALVQRPF
jgi:hypothetical protein